MLQRNIVRIDLNSEFNQNSSLPPCLFRDGQGRGEAKEKEGKKKRGEREKRKKGRSFRIHINM